VAELVPVVRELSLARSVQEVQRIVRRAARSLTGADGATFVVATASNAATLTRMRLRRIQTGRQP